jgi:hypothetical protein
MPQPPQFVPSLFVSTQTPPHVVGFEVGQVHAPLTHVAPVAQSFPHPPQFDSSLERSAQPVEHETRPVGHTHAPPLQVAPAPHALPHAPQLSGSLEVSVHTPGSFPQIAGFDDGHSPHVPLTHAAPDAHALSQPPQCVGSLARSTHVLPHNTSLAGHLHTPEVHTVPALHATPQPPQLESSEVMSTQRDPHVFFGGAHVAPSSGGAVSPPLPVSVLGEVSW